MAPLTADNSIRGRAGLVRHHHEGRGAVKIPAGTTVYEGPVATQGGVYVGGQNVTQIHIPEPWKIPGVQVMSETPLHP